ncbi:helix-turn-helix domain-containing protein [Nonomuraea sediminis]|uniref:helix-turn-helix domain-containing protein n=1 Tax=Nonomuraea sediminis TaxID=2835864 RepID=UPI001BDD2F05|nr:helix-turn-helix domain-containing protein [Nonomuraea sediminis]
MTEHHDVQELSDVDIHVYEAIAAHAVGSGAADVPALIRATGRSEEQVRRSLSTLIEQGHVVPSGEGFALGPHDFEVDY